VGEASKSDEFMNRLKMKRPQTAKMYRKQLDELYAEALAEEEAGTKHIKAKL